MELRSSGTLADSGASDHGDELLVRARDGDAAALPAIIRLAQPLLSALATALYPDESKLIRRTWSRVAREIGCYQPPPALRVWLCVQLIAEAEGGTVPEQPFVAEPAVDPRRFLPQDDARWPGHWAAPPARTPPLSGDGPATTAGREAVLSAAAELPTPMRLVVGLRDVAGCDIDEIAAVLNTSPAETRSRLNAGRARIRDALERCFATGRDPVPGAG